MVKTPAVNADIIRQSIEPDDHGNMARFLETWAPLRKFREPISDSLGNRAHPSIHMYCDTCDSAQTFIAQNDPHQNNFSYERIEKPYDAELWRYRCMGCRNAGRALLLATGSDGKGDYVRKLGQKPQWEAALDPELKKLLGKNAEVYRHGLDCEATGYGVGAY